MFGITAPIMQGGMQWIGKAELAAAVSNAGGLGCITALTYPTPEDLAHAIEQCQELTDRPFAVNVTTLPSITPPPYDEFRRVIIEGGVQVVETSGSNPAEFMPVYRDAGIKVVHKVTSRRHAIKAQEAGVDAVAVIGFEAAGHPGELDTPSLTLLPAIVRELDIPVLGAGGFADGSGLVAALALGADGILMATRFMATREAPIHDRVKAALVAGDELNTALIFRELGNTARVAKNRIALEVARRLAAGSDFSGVRELVAGVRGREVYETGNTEAGIWWAGISQALITDVPDCAELIDRIVGDAEELIAHSLSKQLSE
ncbi:NAD(P)H-dependent flavin oxidoreductase [Leucobacter sp. Z1108]|uniref:NAD(P)H-dependent flavin oxidoreductase n=1 Tax=Leucobacter sp. Z1108 TaxID=3439066 RepID=UPI003F344AA9